MACQWLKVSPSLQKGINIINDLEEIKFEHFLRRIVSKLKLQDSDIFTEEEKRKLIIIFKVDEESLTLAIKTVIYLFKRMLKFIFMPNNLKSDLRNIGFSNEKADVIVKIWSADTKTTLNDLGAGSIENLEENQKFSWKLNAELSTHIRKKSKVSKVYLSVTEAAKDVDLELTHPELYSMFLQLEAVQNELDNIF